MENKAVTTPFSNSYLSWDVFFTGGFSIIVCLAFWAFVDKSTSLLTVSQLAFTLGFVVNHPHFLSSYILLYNDFQKKIFERKRYFFSAIIVPVILGGAIITAMAKQDANIMSHVINSMYFLVGWHYVKQVFGFVIVSSAQRKIYYKDWERKLLLANLISVWFMSALATHVGNNSFDFYGIKHSGIGLPAELMTITRWFVAFSLVCVAAMQLQKYVKEGHKPAPPGVAAFVALYAWYLPVTAHPAFAYLIPFFHSLQYLTFVWLMKKNHVTHEISQLKDEEWRAGWIKKFGGWALAATVLGAMFFEYIPKSLDTWNANAIAAGGGMIAAGTLGHSPFLAAFLLFINIHHYFIDNTIWRSDNEAVKKFLMQAPTNTSDNKSNKKVA